MCATFACSVERWCGAVRVLIGTAAGGGTVGDVNHDDLLRKLEDLADDVDTSAVAGYGLRENVFAETADVLRDLLEVSHPESVASLWQAWSEFTGASTPVSQASALIEFSNLLFHHCTAVLGVDTVLAVPADAD